jgi:hypothetical protein
MCLVPSLPRKKQSMCLVPSLPCQKIIHVFGSKFATPKKNMRLVSSLPRKKNIHVVCYAKKYPCVCSKFATQKKT